MPQNNYEIWNSYCEEELSAFVPILKNLGFDLADEQPHISGERFLMQAATGASGSKLILLGNRRQDSMRVVIKATRNEGGRRELEHQHTCHTALEKINFAHSVFFTPQQIMFTEVEGFTVSVHEFLEQEKQFIDRPLEEQFAYALKAFKAQESAHATTFKHRKLIRNTFGSKHADDYLSAFTLFQKEIVRLLPEKRSLHELLASAAAMLEKNSETIEQYAGFLTHIDFVPHNFRIVGGNIYLLDHSSLCFGNKYEGWARFVNFMELYNPKLARLLETYVRDNKTPEEGLSLYLMRMYRLTEIIWYYTDKLARSSDELLELNKARVQLYTDMLSALLKNEVISENIIEAYKKTRDGLRSEDEKRRQKGLH
jgi:hypothetical protein